jgi:hypothetical protein
MNTKIGLFAIAAVLMGTTACDGTLGLDANANGSLAFGVDRVNSGLLGLSNTPPNEMSSGGHTIVLSSATMTASELELKGLSAGGSGSSSSATASKFETGMVTVSIPVEGGTSREITSQIAAGTYDRFEMDIRTLRVQGTYDGSPFDVTMQINDEMESRLVPALVVADGSASTAVRVALDLQSWFRSEAGGLLDPRQAGSDSTIAATIRANVRSSFDAAEDHDRERADDDSGHQ